MRCCSGFPRHRVRVSLVLVAMLLGLVLTSPARAVGLLIAEDATATALERVSQTVDVNIKAGVAVTTVEQTFRNHTDQPIEAVYSLPLPPTASVTSYTLTVDGDEVTGKVSNDQLTVDPLSPAGYKVLDLGISPIPAGSMPRIRVVYAQRITATADGWQEYTYPLAVATQPGAGDYVQGFVTITANVFADGIAAIRSPTHRLDVNITPVAANQHRATLTLGDGSVTENFVLAWKTRAVRSSPVVYQPAPEPAPQPEVVYVDPEPVQPRVVVVQPRPEVVVVPSRPRTVVVERHRVIEPRSSLQFRIGLGDRSSLRLGYSTGWGSYDRWGHGDRWDRRRDGHGWPTRVVRCSTCGHVHDAGSICRR